MADRPAHEAWHVEQDARMQAVIKNLTALHRWAEGLVAELSKLGHFPTAGSGTTDGDITSDGKEAGHE